jgi:hypothetical protein
LYTCIAPSTVEATPNSTVNPTIKATANQKLYHCTGFRLSFHHCRRLFGWDSSNACFRMTSRSCQKMNLLICLSAAFNRPSLAACQSTRFCVSESLFCLRNQLETWASRRGNNSASVRIVSSTKPGGNRGLGNSSQSCILNRFILPLTYYGSSLETEYG